MKKPSRLVRLLLTFIMLWLPLHEAVAGMQSVDFGADERLSVQPLPADFPVVRKAYVVVDAVGSTVESSREPVVYANLTASKQNAGCHGHDSTGSSACGSCCTLENQEQFHGQLTQKIRFVTFSATINSLTLPREIRPPIL